MKKKEQQQKVKNFFDNISADYSAKYLTTHPFLHYFFHQRLHEATSSFSFENKSILDIGAGTAPLYNFLQNQTKAFQYFATDIAPKMLEESELKKEDYFVGTLSDFPFPEKKYDFIFLLGVTTYFNQKELEKHLAFIQSHLALDGYAIISFTNRKSLDFRLRQLAGFFTRFIKLKKSVLGQDFKIFAYSPSEIKKIINSNFSLHQQTFLNQTFPPFSRLFPKASISLANFLKKNISSPTLLSWMSSDFLVFIQSKKA